MHLNSRLIFEKYAKAQFQPGMRVLEIGPDGFPSSYRKLLGDLSCTWDTIDIFPREGLTHVMKSEYEFPIADGTYDIILSGQVIEHVRKVWVWMRELARVTKPQGTIITINPASWPYHEAPIDCWRAYPEGMKALYDDANLDVDVSVCESLEPGPMKRIPGRSENWQPRRWQVASKILQVIGIPVERAFDTITIGHKRAA